MPKINPRIIKRIVFAMSLSIIFLTLNAQEIPKFKYGKIDKKELQNSSCDIDSSAHAFFLFDSGFSRIEYVNSVGFQIKHTRHCALKIVTKSGYEYADFKIPVYNASSGSMEEKVAKVKAVTYNLEGDKIVKTALNKKDIFKEVENENWTNVSFSMPNVREGSVIEVEYLITSDFLWNLPTWRIQYDIPSKWSILEVSIPEYFNYSKEMGGYLPMYLHENTTSPDRIIFPSKFDIDEGPRRNFESNQVVFDRNNELYVSKDIPAFKHEPYIDAVQNYISKIVFELKSSKFPNEGIENYTTTWGDICKDLMLDEDFGKKMNAINNSKEIINELNLDGLSAITKAELIFNYVQKATKWNKIYSKYCSNLKQVMKTGVGNSGDINIMLINILDAAGLDVNPVLLKTKSSGKLPFAHPSLSSLNYVIAAVKLDEALVLLDATEDNLPFDFLPERCLNEKGVLIDRESSKMEWQELAEEEFSVYSVYGDLEIKEDGEINAKLSKKRLGYSAFNRRQDLEDEQKENIIEEFQKENIGFIVENYDVENREFPEEFLKESIDGLVTEKVMIAGDMMYFNPCIFEKYDENPFKIEKREYPINFTYPRQNQIVYSFAIPENWALESVPENFSIILSDKGVSYRYSIQQIGGKILVSQVFRIVNTFYLPDSYKDLKEFFKQMVDKQREQIVLKRI